jgi:hypothetical protein
VREAEGAIVTTPPDDTGEEFTAYADQHGPLSRSRLRREAIQAGRDPVPPDDTTEGEER